jgi:DNA-binding transcriptional LysR family regulator
MRDGAYSYAERMDVQLHQLKALVAVLDAGTFTDAATALGVSQASVSRAVAALEAALGRRLLDRTTRHVAPTPTGVRVAAQARRVLAEVARLRLITAPRPELRVGYAWAALGRHTRKVQRAWAAAHPGVPLVFVQVDDPTAGLADGTAELSVVRRAPDGRFGSALIGTERRYAALSTDDPLARRRSVTLADLARRPIAMDERTGTTTPDLWPEPVRTRPTHGVDEWLTLIAAGQAVGVTPEATAHQNPRPGVAYRVVRDAPPVSVLLAWWRADPPDRLDELLALAREAYGVSI